MASLVEITQLSPTMTEGVLVEWIKNEGDTISPGDIIASVETDKAVMELEAFEEGVLLSQTAKPSTRLPVGSPIGIIGEAGEDISDLLKEVQASLASRASGAPAAGSKEVKEDVKAPAPQEEKIVPPSPPKAPEPVLSETPVQPKSVPQGKIKASPLAKKLASMRNIPLETISGSGPGGRIVKRDVEAVRAQPGTGLEERAQDQTILVSMMRQSIAKRLVESKSLIPHFYLTKKIRLGELAALRKEINQDLSLYHERGNEQSGLLRPSKLSINDFIIRANALALEEHPDVNAQWGQDSIILKGNVDVGIAVAIEDGLITPVIRNASKKNIFQIALEVRHLAKKARDRKLSVDEFTGGTFTISNLGMYGIDSFSAILNPPEAGIMAVGASVLEPFYDSEKEAFVPQEFISVTLSCDHRVIDGAKGAEYLKTFTFFIEHPRLLL